MCCWLRMLGSKELWVEEGAILDSNSHVTGLQIRCMCMLEFALVNVLRGNLYNNLRVIYCVFKVF